MSTISKCMSLPYRKLCSLAANLNLLITEIQEAIVLSSTIYYEIK